LKLSPNIIQKIKVTLVKETTEEQKREEEAIAYFKKGIKLSRENRLEEAIQAFYKLEKGVEVDDPNMIVMGVVPLFVDLLHNEPRFQELLGKMNLPAGK